ncbi:MAG: hypothetical protein QOK43_640 [Acidimicrobiaceae bacterium]|nr:hypothetical protein [Acidimicrobiaceae bacterium]
MTASRPRVGVHLGPLMLHDALSRVLVHIGLDDVVDLRDDPTAPCDGAVVGEGMASPAGASVVIRLFEDGTAAVEHHATDAATAAADHADATTDDAVSLDSMALLLAVLDAHCPAEGPRVAGPIDGPKLIH